VSLTVSIDVETSTPASIGWYEPSKQDPVGLRASEVKGLWRWWSRVCIAGAMYDLGLLRGKPVEGNLIGPDKAEIKAVSYLVGKILGLGYAGEEGSEASRFTIHISASEARLRKIKLKALANLLQRPRLLTIKQDIEGIDRGSRFTIVVRRRVSRYPDAEELALKILYLAIQLSGLGKGSRRGMGSLDVISISGITLSYSGLRELLDEVYSGCIKIVENYKSTCLKYLSPGQQLGIPPMPVLSKNKYQGNVNVAQVYIVENVRFEDIHNFFLRSQRCRVLYNKSDCQDDLRKNLAAWVLGLPREQRGTGYSIATRGVSRRASPILISYHSKRNSLGSGAFVSVFLSGDWPKVLEWRGAGSSSRKIVVDPQVLVNAYITAINELSKYLSSLRTSLRPVWP
jgi:CRISPR-associated protein Cmr1